MKLKNKLLKIVYGKCPKCGGELEEVENYEEALKLQRKVHTIDISENSINNFILPKLDEGLNYEQGTY